MGKNKTNRTAQGAMVTEKEAILKAIIKQILKKRFEKFDVMFRKCYATDGDMGTVEIINAIEKEFTPEPKAWKDDFAELYHLRGMIWERLGRDDLAMLSYTLAINLHPKRCRSTHYLSRSRLKKKLGDLQGAERDSNLFKKFYPKSKAEEE